MGSTGASRALTVGKHDINTSGGTLRYEVEAYGGSPTSIFIHGIVVDADKRGTGIGTKLLDKVLKLSDKSGLTVELFAIPIKDTTMTHAELIAWYKKRGFTQATGGVMQYKPKR